MDKGCEVGRRFRVVSLVTLSRDHSTACSHSEVPVPNSGPGLVFGKNIYFVGFNFGRFYFRLC